MTRWIICRKKQRDVNAFELTAIGIGSSLAVGVFVVLGELIKNVTGPAVLVSIILAGVTALFGGVCFAEFSVQYLKADSAYIFSYSFSKKHSAFVFGWALILKYVTGAASVGKGIINFIDSLAENKISNLMKDIAATNFKNVFVYFDFVSMAIIVVGIIILAFGVKDCTVVVNIFTVFNIMLVVAILIVGFFKVDMENWHTNEPKDEKSKGGFMPFGILSVTKGAAIAFYAFIGFDNIGVTGSEIKRREKNVPIAVMSTIICVFLAYTGIGIILTLMLPYYELNQYAALPFAFERLESTTAKWIITIATFFGFVTSLFGALFPLPKVIQAMARDGLLFSFLHKYHLKAHISKTAILFGGFLSGAAAGIFSFQILVNLTVLGALCIYTIIAVNVILTRNFQRIEPKNRLESSLTCTNGSSETSIKSSMRNCFAFKRTITANLTKKIVVGNLILYCLSSIGLGVMHSVFSDSLFKGSIEAVVPTCIFLCILLLSLFSLIRQPKLQTVLPFEVPFVPFFPCLSIFLNIFLMTTFDSITWLLFSGWMVLGVLFHLFYQGLGSYNVSLGKNSLYEINKTNAVKLNEAVWKIKSEKKALCAGAVNPVFFDELENNVGESKTIPESSLQIQNEKAIMQLKQAEIIQTAETIMEEKAEPLEDKPEFLGQGGNSPEENTSVLWECVAEIHTEEEFPQENIVLEIVDNTYNFLSEVSEESLNDNVSQKSVCTRKKSTEPLELSDRTKDSDILEEFMRLPNNLIGDIKHDELQNPYKNLLFQDELFNKIKGRRKTIEESNKEKNIVTEIILQNPEKNEIENDFVNFVIETLYEAPHDNMITRTHKTICNTDAKENTNISEEHNRIKEFKEKLNQVLKNQLNFGENPKKSFTVLKSEAEDAEMNRKKSEATLVENIKTLNKTQIKGKLEVLLAKGPPKRPSFRNQFRSNFKEHKEVEKKESKSETHPPEESTLQPTINIVQKSR